MGKSCSRCTSPMRIPAPTDIFTSPTAWPPQALCESLGDALAGTCKAYVDVYAPAVYVALQQYLQPDPLCQVGACC